MSFIICSPIGRHLHIIELHPSPTVSMTHVASNSHNFWLFCCFNSLFEQATYNQSVLLIESYESMCILSEIYSRHLSDVCVFDRNECNRVMGMYCTLKLHHCANCEVI